MQKSKRKEIAPQLIHGWRDKTYGRLPHYVKEGLKDIARSENKSLSWTVEEVIIRFFGFKRPQYRMRKKKS